MVSGQPHRVVGAGITTLVISDLRCPAGPVPWLRGQGGQDPEETHDQPSYLVASDFTRQQRWCLCPTVGTSQIPGPGRAATHQPLPQKRFPAPLVIHTVPACPSFPCPSMAAAPTTQKSPSSHLQPDPAGHWAIGHQHTPLTPATLTPASGKQKVELLEVGKKTSPSYTVSCLERQAVGERYLKKKKLIKRVL